MTATGVAGLFGIPSILASSEGSQPGFRWWWPTEWMFVPAAIFLIGIFLVLVPVRRTDLQGGESLDTAGAAPRTPLSSAPAPVESTPPTTVIYTTPQGSKPTFEIGVGVPGWRGPFAQAWNELMQPSGTPPISILDASTDVYWDGPGVVQHFDSLRSAFGWVLCALPSRRIVLVAGEVWEALKAAGGGAIGSDPLSAIGYPTADPQTTRRIAADALHLDLSGGTWGPGRLLRESEDQDWRWEPETRFRMDMTRNATAWAGSPPPRLLRARAVVTLPWAQASTLSVNPQRRHDLELALPGTALAGVITTLSQRRGGEAPVVEWRRGPHTNALDWLSYSCSIAAPDGRAALSAEVMMMLPNSMNSDVVTCAELRIEDLTAWADALTACGATPPEDLRLDLKEIADFFTVAWQTAAEVLPAAVTDEAFVVRWTDPPRTEFRLTAERAMTNPPLPEPMLDDFVDTSALGHSDRDHLTQLTVTITAPQHIEPASRQDLTRRALAYVAQQFGYLDVTESTF